MPRPLILLRPMNGLGNRMRAVAAARALALATGARLRVLWEVVPDLAARYEDLFVATDDFDVVNVEPSRSLADAAYLVAYSQMKSVRGAPTAWIGKLLFPGPRLSNLRPEHVAPEALERLVKTSRRLFIDSWWAFYGGKTLDFLFFRVRPELVSAATPIAERFGPASVGVHIRRADNGNAMRYSPTSAFIAAMRHVVDAEPATTFFLATDSRETEREIVEVFGPRVITRERELKRDCREGMLDAMIDMYLLSRTRRVLGSYYSTFSETAASLGGIAWATVTDDPSLVGKINADVLLVRSGAVADDPFAGRQAAHG